MAKKIKVNVFDDLRGSLQDAVAFERGEQVNLGVVELPDPARKLRARDIRNISQLMKATQVVFAAYLNVIPNTVRSWEQGTRRPQGADLKLLAIVRKNPKARLEA